MHQFQLKGWIRPGPDVTTIGEMPNSLGRQRIQRRYELEQRSSTDDTEAIALQRKQCEIFAL